MGNMMPVLVSTLTDSVGYKKLATEWLGGWAELASFPFSFLFQSPMHPRTLLQKKRASSLPPFSLSFSKWEDQWARCGTNWTSQPAMFCPISASFGQDARHVLVWASFSTLHLDPLLYPNGTLSPVNNNFKGNIVNSIRSWYPLYKDGYWH